MSRSSPVIDWQRNYERDKREGTGPNAQKIHPTERIQIFWNVGVQLVGIVPYWCNSEKSSSSKFPLSATPQRRTTHAKAQEWKVVWWRSLRPQSSWTSEGIFCWLSSNFKNTVVSRNDIGDLLKEYAEKEEIMSQQRRKLASIFHLTNGNIITPLLLFYLHLCLDCTKVHHFVRHTPKKCFNSFVQSAVNARRQGDENPNSSVVAETIKCLANSSCGYQIIDRSRYTVRKYLSDKKLTVQLLINFSSDTTSSLINFTRLNLSFNRNWASRTNHCRILYFAIC